VRYQTSLQQNDWTSSSADAAFGNWVFSQPVQEGEASAERFRKNAERERDSLDNKFQFAQSHVQELIKSITNLEDAKHKIEQQAQEETLQLRQRLLDESEASKVRHCLH
jgi:hypothetical protein